MTGYGKAVGMYENKKLTIEIKSLNSKQSDMNIRIPVLYKSKEMEIRKMVHNSLKRGKIELSMYVESSGDESNFEFNKELAKKYFNQLKDFAYDCNVDLGDIISTVMRMPEVMQNERQELSEEEWTVVNVLVQDAIKGLTEFRAQEGAKLKVDFEERIAIILELLKVVEANEAIRVDSIKARLQKALTENMGKENYDSNRFEQELIFYIEKLDITEEKVRLRAHCDYFIENLNSKESNGKKLGFIIQEIGREINTIGSKANNADIQRSVVQMKDELEKIKEQMLNVL